MISQHSSERHRIRLALAATLAWAGFVADTNTAWAGDAKAGLKITQELCGRCHAYDPENPWNSIGNSPSFMLMAKKLESYEYRILSVTGRRPHASLDFDLTDIELENIVAFVQTLRPD